MKINTYWAIVKPDYSEHWEINTYRMQSKRALRKYFEEQGIEYKAIYTEQEFEKLGKA